MQRFFRHWPRILVTLAPLVFALAHAIGWLPLGILSHLDNIVYDARLRATMPQTLDERIVIVDIDAPSLAELGRWPWSRNTLATLVDEVLVRQGAVLLGLDMVFAEADDSSGLQRLQQLAQNELRDVPAFRRELTRLAEALDYDALLVKAVSSRPVVLGYYFTNDSKGYTSGVIAPPIMSASAFDGRHARVTNWTGFGANLPALAAAAPQAGFFNSITDDDGVVRSLALVSAHAGQYYESLSLAMFRRLVGLPAVVPGFSGDKLLSASEQQLESVVLQQAGARLVVPVDLRAAALIPFRGAGGARGGSFRYLSAADVVAQRVPAGSLAGKIVLLGTTAPGLLDLRVTPVGTTYPGVETHASLISGLLDGRILTRPDYADGFEVLMLLLTGVSLAMALPLLSASQAVGLSVAVVGAMVGINFWLYLGAGLVLPLASIVVTGVVAFALNMSYGYLVESRSKRQLAELFGAYVPPELVDEMVIAPHRYNMRAATRELTVLFCDMRGFTALSETMAPTQLQALLNTVFSRLTTVIRINRGTIDKYMGDCVMAFWGAPVEAPDQAHLAVKAAVEMAQAVRQLNREYRLLGLPEISVGIGLNSGSMCVGDMGSALRRSYTVIGDEVNLGARLEGLSATYGVDIVVSQSTRALAPDFSWQELDCVRVKGKDRAVTIFTPLAHSAHQPQELAMWPLALAAYRAQQWAACTVLLSNLHSLNADKFLYQLYAERVRSRQALAMRADWDGVTSC